MKNIQGTKKLLIVYPDNSLKPKWDILMAVLLCLQCCSIPIQLAFHNNDTPSWWIIYNYTADALFFIDILVIFNTAYYDVDLQLLDDRKTLAKNYIYSWLFIDLLAIIPFGLMNSSIEGDSKLVRVTRVGRLYKLVKLNRLLKMLKILKLKSKVKIMDGAKSGYERMIFFMMIFLILIHIVACCWVIIP